MTDRTDTQLGFVAPELVRLERGPGLARALPPLPKSIPCATPAECKSSAVMLGRYVRKLGVSERKLVRDWGRNGRTTVKAWMNGKAGDRVPGARFVRWLFHVVSAAAQQSGEQLPEAASW